MTNRRLTNDEIQLLIDFAERHIAMAENSPGRYAAVYMGGDPHNFTPDPEDPTREQIARRKATSDARDPCERSFPRKFGLGGTEDQVKDQFLRLRALLNELDNH